MFVSKRANKKSRYLPCHGFMFYRNSNEAAVSTCKGVIMIFGVAHPSGLRGDVCTGHGHITEDGTRLGHSPTNAANLTT